jgi:hypothetical protein
LPTTAVIIRNITTGSREVNPEKAKVVYDARMNFHREKRVVAALKMN